MKTTRPLTTSMILKRVGRLPAASVAAAALCAVPFAAAAQDQPGEARVNVSDSQLIDLAVKDEEITNLLEMLSLQTKRNIVVSKNVSGRVSATLYGATFHEAMDAILNVNGFVWEERGNFIHVYTFDEWQQIEKARRTRVVKVVRLNYLNANDALQFVEPMLSTDGGEIRVAAETADFSIPGDAPVGKDNYALGATLVIIDFEENVAAIQQVISELDTRPAQVLVEATILQASINEANAFGTDFSIIADVNFSDFLNIGGPLAAADSLIRGGTGASVGLSPADNQATAITSTPGNTAGPGTFKVGVIADDISIFVRLLDEVTDTTILSNPKILTLNRQAARVLVGRRVGYLNTTSTDTATTQTVEFLDTGTQLYFRPFVTETGEIRMELKPQVSEAIIREATDAGGAVVTIPDEITQELVTNVIVRDGQTIVLGGLFKETTQFTRRQVPFVGDLPIIGAAFRGNEDETNRSEIIFLITPTLVSDALIDRVASIAMDDIERVRAGTRQGLLPWSREKLTASLNLKAERLAREGEFDRAAWMLSRSLSLSPIQPDALRLRERLTGTRELWPDRGILEGLLEDEVGRRLNDLPEPDSQPHYYVPDMGTPVPLEPSREFPAPPGVDVDLDPRPRSIIWPFVEGDDRRSDDDEDDDGESVGFVTEPTTRRGNGRSSPAFVSGGPAAAPATTPQMFEANRRNVAKTLAALRGKIELFKATNGGGLPQLGSSADGGWSALIKTGLLTQAPINPFVSGGGAGVVIASDGPITKNTNAFGWVYSPKTGDLWATGFDGNDKPIAFGPSGSQGAATPIATVPENGGN